MFFPSFPRLFAASFHTCASILQHARNAPQRTRRIRIAPGEDAQMDGVLILLQYIPQGIGIAAVMRRKMQECLHHFMHGTARSKLPPVNGQVVRQLALTVPFSPSMVTTAPVLRTFVAFFAPIMTGMSSDMPAIAP